MSGFIQIRPNGRAYARWTDPSGSEHTKLIPGQPLANGKTWRRVRRGDAVPEGFITFGDAKAWSAAEQARGAAPAASAPASMNAVLTDFLAYCAEEGCAPATLRDYRSTVQRWLRPAWGKQRVVDVEDVRALRRKMLAAGKSERTVDKTLTVAHRVFRVAGIVPNPIAAAAELRPATKAARAQREAQGGVVSEPYFTGPQVATIVDQAIGLDGAMYRFAAHTGLRLGELLELRFSDAQGRWLRVARSVDKGDRMTGPVVGPPKSGRARSVPLDDVALAILAGQEDGSRPMDTTLVFPDLTRRYGDWWQHPDTAGDRFRALTEELGLYMPRKGLHRLRHSFGTYAVDLGVAQSQVRDWMGHRDERTTEGYRHAVLDAPAPDGFGSGWPVVGGALMHGASNGERHGATVHTVQRVTRAGASRA